MAVRKLRNRMSAAQSRKKRENELEQLREYVKELENRSKELSIQLEVKNQTIQSLLQALNGRTGDGVALQVPHSAVSQPQLLSSFSSSSPSGIRDTGNTNYSSFHAGSHRMMPQAGERMGLGFTGTSIGIAANQSHQINLPSGAYLSESQRRDASGSDLDVLGSFRHHDSDILQDRPEMSHHTPSHITDVTQQGLPAPLYDNFHPNSSGNGPHIFNRHTPLSNTDGHQAMPSQMYDSFNFRPDSSGEETLTEDRSTKQTKLGTLNRDFETQCRGENPLPIVEESNASVQSNVESSRQN